MTYSVLKVPLNPNQPTNPTAWLSLPLSVWQLNVVWLPSAFITCLCSVGKDCFVIIILLCYYYIIMLCLTENMLVIILLQNTFYSVIYAANWFWELVWFLASGRPCLLSWCQSPVKIANGLRPVILQYGTGTGTVTRPQVRLKAYCQLVSIPSCPAVCDAVISM